jgi:hypothetical protein
MKLQIFQDTLTDFGIRFRKGGERKRRVQKRRRRSFEEIFKIRKRWRRRN